MATTEYFKVQITESEGAVRYWSGAAESPERLEELLLKSYPGAIVTFLGLDPAVDFMDERVRAEMVEVDSIIPGERFRKEYQNIEQLAESIRKYGLIHFIVIDEFNNLVAGGRRLEAVKLLGWKKVQCVRKQNVNPLRLREMELEENIQRSDMTWQEEVALKDAIANLKIQIYGQKASGQGSKTGGISQNDVAKMLGDSPASLSMDRQLAQAIAVLPELAKCKTKDDARKQLKKLAERAILTELVQRQAQPGISATPKYKLAEVSFILGDAIAALRETPKGDFGFINVDTPYGVDLDERDAEKGGQAIVDSGYAEWRVDEYLQKCSEVATELFRISDNCFMTWWFGEVWQKELYEILAKVGWKVDQVPAIWCSMGSGRTCKPNLLLGRAYEPFFVCWKGDPVLIQRGHSNVFMHQGVAASDRIHSTEKPLSLIKEIYDVFCPPTANILVPFLGSGNDILAALQTKRSCKGWDINQQARDRFLVRAHELFGEDI